MNHSNKFILFNGPPYCGKDTAAQILGDILSAKTKYVIEHIKFAAPLKKMAQIFTHLDLDDPIQYDTFKKTTITSMGITGRELMIKFSEEFIKPQFGDDYFGKYLVNNLSASEPTIYLISDSGFQSETVYLVKSVGEDNVLVCNIHRPSTSFEQDSRNRINHTNIIDIINEGGLDYLKNLLEDIYYFNLTPNNFLEESLCTTTL